MSAPRKRGRPAAKPDKRANGDGSVYWVDKRGRWVGAITVAIDGGKPQRRFVSATSESDCWKKLHALKERADILDLTTKMPTIAQLARQWLDNYDRGHAEASTRSIRAERVTKHIIDDPRIGSLLADKVKPEHVERWLQHKVDTGYVRGTKRSSYSPSSIRDFRLDLSQIMGWAVGRRKIDWNPVRHIDAIQVEASAEKRSLTPDQAAHLLRECAGTNRRYGALVMTVLLQGARPGEVAGLPWANIDFDAGVIHYRQALKRRSGGVPIGIGATKTKKQRSITAPTILLDALRHERKVQAELRLAAGPEWSIEWDGLVFLGSTGVPPSASNLRRTLRAIVADAGLDVDVDDLDPYELRHTCASVLDDHGVPVNEIISQLGWADDRMFYKHYRHKVDPISGTPGASAWERILGA